jgi:hypothetical protein
MKFTTVLPVVPMSLLARDSSAVSTDGGFEVISGAPDLERSERTGRVRCPE